MVRYSRLAPGGCRLLWAGESERAANLETIFRVRNCNHPLDQFCLVCGATKGSLGRAAFHVHKAVVLVTEARTSC